ncbi:MAG: outer membrane lipoprotein carrier protein LolA [Elusimicrobia bacterium]|nr:outer membrane lipoprotein carrier protein LolA [Elusimicrobiota bacterium]
MKKFLSIIFVLLTTNTYFLLAENIDDILKRMEEADSKIADLSFSFKQEILVTITLEKSNILGEAVFKKPDLFKIEHKEPEKQVVISDGKKIYFYQKEFNQVMIDDWKSLSQKGSFPKGIFNFTSTIPDLRKNYNISLIENGTEPVAKYYVILLELKEKQPQSTKIRLWVSKESYLAEKTEIKTETITSTVVISGIKTNKGIKDSFFRFKIPKGVQIITSPF